MGRLFENMDKMDIQAERRNTQMEKERADKAEENGIRQYILLSEEFNAAREDIIENLMKAFQLKKEEAVEKLNLYLKTK